MRKVLAIALFATVPGSAIADDEDPLADAPDAADATRLTWFGDLLLRGDYTQDLPFNLPDEQRARLRLRSGLRWQASNSLEIGAAVEGSYGSDSARVIRLAHDNERINDVNVDQLYARWQFAELSAMTLGKTPFAPELSPMVWDNDLRPVGVGIEHAVAVRSYDRLQFNAGYFAGDLLYDDQSRIFAAQAAWHIREGAPSGGSVLFTLLDFEELDGVVRSGLARSNRRAPGGLLSDFRLADLQFAWRTEADARPLEARLDLVRNLGADDQRDGARGSLVWGDSQQAQQWELGFSYQRVQRDAVMAAFNSEAWWFHSATRGAMPWVAYGISEHWRAQLSVFIERADGRDETTDRALLDLRATW